jgi:hypothetical protein
VHFLDNLHAKFYIGNDVALLGSCNLSANGMGDDGLREAAVMVDGKCLIQLNQQFERYKQDAQRSYKTLEAKMNRLQKLQGETNRAFSSGLLARPEETRSITEYDSQLDHIHIIGLTDPDGEPDATKIAEQEPELVEVSLDVDRYFDDWLQLEKRDTVERGDWFLCWWCTNNRHPDGRRKAYWFYADCVVDQGMASEQWPKFVGQVRGPHPTAPFDLDDATQTAIREVLNVPEFMALIPGNDWRLEVAKADRVTPQFLDAVKERVRNNLAA